jgi:histidyl-tRNA synthetase
MPKVIKKSPFAKATGDKPVVPPPTTTPVDATLPKPKKGPPTPQTLRGMKDILPVDQKYWALLRRKAEELADVYGFQRIDTPILEETALFVRGVGKATDMVEKEMFTFLDQGEESMTLRPEHTAPIARAFINHGMWNLPQPIRLFDWGPVFRHERPQAGRFRQFTQGGMELFGDRHPVIDAHLIHVAWSLFKEIGLEVIVQVNSIGDAPSREVYKEKLVAFYRTKRSAICENCKKRLVKNPMRVLDCKEDGCVAVRAEAPQIIDHLNEESKNHFVRVLEYLDELQVPYQLNPYLVRGLDYYTHTVFEVVCADEGELAAQGALAAGGRYDGLVETLGGPATPACGFGWGIERIILKLKDKNIPVPELPMADVYLAQLGEPARRRMLALFGTLRVEGIRVAENFSRDALKAQLEVANRLGVRYTLILGQKEVLDGTILIRDMDSGIQEIVDFKKVTAELKKKLAQPALARGGQLAPPPVIEPEEEKILFEEEKPEVEEKVEEEKTEEEKPKPKHKK